MIAEKTTLKTDEKQSQPSAPENLRRLRFQLRRLWRLPHSWKASPALFGIILATMVSLGATAASWVLVRLLPDMALISTLAKDFPKGFFALLARLPQLLSEATPSTVMVTGALVSQEAYIITYACGAASIFCILLLAVALIRKW